MTTTTLDASRTHAERSTENRASDHGGKFLTFKLADEEYGVEILKVREINGVIDITAVPRMPAFVKGVINLRGKVIPVIDLRLRFGLEELEHTEQTCIIVVDVGREIGIIVDTVSEVLDIAGEDIEPPPSMGGSVDTSFILGMGKVDKTVKILLDIDKVLTNEELTDVTSVAMRAEGSD
jgi:purine-binding chemotaxis protein CheW